MYHQIKHSKITTKQTITPSLWGGGGGARRIVRNFELGNQAQGHTETRFLFIFDMPGIGAKTAHINVRFSQLENDNKTVPNPETCFKRHF